MTSYSIMMNRLQRTFNSGKTKSLDFRREQIRCLKRLLEENQDQLADAIWSDLRRSKTQAVCYEVYFGMTECDTTLKKLAEWAKPEKVDRPLEYMIDDAMLIKEPLGVVLIMSAWNYPVHLIFHPMIAALAAGNCIVLKPSEIASHTADVVAGLVPKYFSPDVVQVVCGGVKETSELLEEKFDHIFYTGSPTVGKIIMKAASEHLTPVTLELGGKCPAIIDNQCDIGVAARRLTWGKLLNAGQTCLAPDYVIVTSSKKSELIREVKSCLKEFYGTDAKKADDYARIVNQRHFDRLHGLLENTKSTLLTGGSHDRDELYIEPTILDDVTLDDVIMQDEIFGPIMPIVTVKSFDEAIDVVNSKEKPLACYLFSKNQRNVNRLLNETSSGGVTINDCLLHMTVDTLPFGGVGNSGMGRYHGKYGFDTFSHEKAVLHRSTRGESMMWMRYPPYDERKSNLMKGFTQKKRELPNVRQYFLPAVLIFGIILGMILKTFI